MSPPSRSSRALSVNACRRRCEAGGQAPGSRRMRESRAGKRER
ncbi:hypothetical protein L810_4733 [Burkholderia sp. AU4i]|nr:hypothetical protein L810_4733 [Burkholderia sp. AU4i]